MKVANAKKIYKQKSINDCLKSARELANNLKKIKTKQEHRNFYYSTLRTEYIKKQGKTYLNKIADANWKKIKLARQLFEENYNTYFFVTADNFLHSILVSLGFHFWHGNEKKQIYIFME